MGRLGQRRQFGCEGAEKRCGADEGADYMQNAVGAMRVHIRLGLALHPKEQDWAVRPKSPLTRFDSKGTGRGAPDSTKRAHMYRMGQIQKFVL